MTPHDHWVCVQSVVADHDGNLWVLDPASPAIAGVVPGGPKLVKIDLGTNKVTQTIAFDEKTAPPYSYLNDVRFSPDMQAAYITDSGLKGALVVVDLKSGAARRLLEGHPSTMPEKDVVVHTDGTELRRPDGRTAEFASDGIELSKDGKHLYWQALTGKTLYRIPTDALHDAKMSNEALATKIERIGENGVSDGLWIDRAGTMYIQRVGGRFHQNAKGRQSRNAHPRQTAPLARHVFRIFRRHDLRNSLAHSRQRAIQPQSRAGTRDVFVYVQTCRIKTPRRPKKLISVCGFQLGGIDDVGLEILLAFHSAIFVSRLAAPSSR